MKDISQVEILKAIKNKDKVIYKYLFDDYFEKLVFFAEYFILDRNDSEDIVQDVFYDLWERSSDVKIISNLKSYLFVQVKNKCLNRLKHLNVVDKHKQWLWEAQVYADIPEVNIDRELMQKVYAAIDELPEQSQKIFRDCVLNGKKYKEVAEDMGISVNTVNTQMKRAYKYLRTKLGVAFMIFLTTL